jgi:hypothetical protein
MNMQKHLTRGLAGIVLTMLTASPLRAADPALEDFRAAIDAVVGGLAPATSGILEWAGADPYEIRREGDVLVATITGAKMTIHGDDFVHLTLDRVEIRQGGPDGRNSADLAVLLPKQVMFTESDGTETRVTIADGRLDAAIDRKTGRIQATAAVTAGVRFDQPKTGIWVSFGPLAMTSKLVAEPDGRWSAPSEFELKKVEFHLPQGPGSGGIDRLAFTGLSTGPKAEELERLRDTLSDLQNDKSAAPDVRLARLFAVLPTIPSVFGAVRGDAVLEGLSVRDNAGEPLVSLAKAEFAAQISGLDRDVAALRFTIREDGLKLAPSLVEPVLVPHRVVIDFGVENLATAALNAMLRAASLTGSASEAEQQQASEQMLGSMATLNPVGKIYDIAIETQDVGAALTAESKGTPLSPTGYTAEGDLVVRGWDALPKLAEGTPFLEYLPFLKEFSEAVKAADGAPRLKFHLASSPQKWAAVNGNDVSLWFDGSEPSRDQPRLLKPAEPPMQGADVKDVQRALAAAKLPVEQDGVYRISTATAVARFQKQKGMNVSGVVDIPTRRALGLRGPAARPSGRN